MTNYYALILLIGLFYANSYTGILADSFHCYPNNSNAVNAVAVGEIIESGIDHSNEKIRDCLKQAAVKGDAEAQYQLGRYLFLYGAPEHDDTKHWLQKSAAQNNQKAKLLLQVNYEIQTLTEEEAKRAWALVIQDANSGKPEDQYFIGYLYALSSQNNETVNQDAEKWLTLAAENNLPEAQVELGRLYQKAGLKKEAEKWFLLAAETGYTDGENSLGTLYYMESLIVKDGKEDFPLALKAEKWLLMAASKNNSSAMYSLGDLYSEGHSLQKDYKKALDWYLKALDEDEKQNDLFLFELFGYSKIAKIYAEGGYGINKDLYKARNWYQKAAEAGDSDGSYEYAVMLYQGAGGNTNYSEASKWFQKILEEPPASFAPASVDGDKFSAIPLYIGEIYYYGGYGVEQNYAQAKRWYEQAAASGYLRAYWRLGTLFLEGKSGIVQDYQEAKKWFLKGAAQGDTHSNFQLGIMSFQGLGISKNYTEAVKWFAKVANNGNSNAQFNLGLIYSIGGFGLERNYIHAHKWYNIAAANGNYNAIERREKLESKMTTTQINAAQKLARSWKATD